MKFDPHPNCGGCARLKRFRIQNKQAEPDWHNAPVDSWLPQCGEREVELLIIGLAPGLKGANRTGIPFTGDFSGELLFDVLRKNGFASLSPETSGTSKIKLHKCAITNAVRCVPPQNKPIGAEINKCRPFLLKTIQRFENLKILVTLGKIAHDSTIRALGERVIVHKFAHNKVHNVGGFSLISSYHCSRYNVNTGVLTRKMFEDVFMNAEECNLV